MLRPAAAVAAATFATQAFAVCGPGHETFLSCTVSGGAKSLDLCHDANTVTYAYGPDGGPPELALSTPVAEIGYEPWPGIGRTIWEKVTLRNGEFAYAVHGAIERDYPEDEAQDIIVTVTGEIEVLRGEERLATLACDPGSVVFPWGDGLHTAKTEAGLCLDHATRAWLRCE